MKNALVVSNFMDDEGALPHSVNVRNLNHFKGVGIPVISHPKSIDILIGKTDKLLLIVLKEREGLLRDEPNLVITRVGPIASGGRANLGSNLPPNQKVKLRQDSDSCNTCKHLKQEIATLKESVRNFEREDELIQPSKHDKIARGMVEANVKVINGRCKIPVPFKSDVLKTLSNNYTSALKRTQSLRRNAQKSAKLKGMLFETFKEMISEGWVEPVENGAATDSRCWYFPFFVTKQEKSRVVFGRAAKFDGTALNDVVLPGINLLNGLVEVLTQFRVGRYACMADLSKCFLQVSVPESKKDQFRLVWFKDNDRDEGEIQILKFTRHVRGVNPNPYIALFAIEKLVAANPTNASNLTLSAVESRD